ncbi:MAG TPA: hypothetical protein H9702_00640 [Candidatus Merdibacter merdavium]|uniref:Uncharacterized protein n=1 Tax=Candidatus Merdibacter merdavium TaxID=2838692 RepID=A0A9D2SV87_9FIRM|nr:hypothetical protein [Candidatus Merdibacter merdavium]
MLVEISAGKSAEKKASVHKNMEPEDYEDDSEFPLDMQCKIGVKKVSGKFTDFYNFHESAIKVY